MHEQQILVRLQQGTHGSVVCCLNIIMRVLRIGVPKSLQRMNADESVASLIILLNTGLAGKVMETWLDARIPASQLGKY